jgi:hypothetical protein
MASACQAVTQSGGPERPEGPCRTPSQAEAQASGWQVKSRFPVGNVTLASAYPAVGPGPGSGGPGPGPGQPEGLSGGRPAPSGAE